MFRWNPITSSLKRTAMFFLSLYSNKDNFPHTPRTGSEKSQQRIELAIRARLLPIAHLMGGDIPSVENLWNDDWEGGPVAVQPGFESRIRTGTTHGSRIPGYDRILFVFS
jgi:hypothetical protein